MKKHFLTGLAILLPLVITLMVLVFLIHLLTQPFIGIVSGIFTKLHFIDKGFLFLSPEQLIRYSSQAIILLLLFFLTVLLGLIARWFFIHAIFKVGDKIIRWIPVVNAVYKTTKEIINTLFVSDKTTFKQVVMVPFPHPGVYVLGLISRESPVACQRAVKEGSLISVFVPTTPNPTTGFMLLLKKEDLVYVNLRSEEALKYIISCGMIVPKEPQEP